MKKNALRIIAAVKALLYSRPFKERNRKNSKSFTRNRKLNFTSLIVFLTNLIRKTLQIELDEFVRLLSGDPRSRASRQAFGKARKNLRHEAFRELDEKLIEEHYTDNEYKLWRGFRLMGIDGSTVQLPSSQDIVRAFGSASNQHGVMAMARISCVYDLENRLCLHSSISRYHHCESSKKARKGIGERDLAFGHVMKIKELDDRRSGDSFHSNDLFLFDMGYPSLEFIAYLSWLGKEFVFRCSNFFLKEVREAVARGLPDQIIEVRLRGPKRGFTKRLESLAPGLSKDAVLKSRVILIDLPSGEREILVSSLTDGTKFSHEDFGPLYQKRWGSETNYSDLKNILEIENFSGLSAESVRQDFHATVFTNNLKNLIQAEVQSEVDEDNRTKNRKYEYKVNNNLSLGRLKNKLVRLLSEEEGLDVFYEDLKRDMKRGIVPVRPGRAFPRKKKNHGLKYKMNRKRAI